MNITAVSMGFVLGSLVIVMIQMIIMRSDLQECDRSSDGMDERRIHHIVRRHLRTCRLIFALAAIDSILLIIGLASIGMGRVLSW